MTMTREEALAKARRVRARRLAKKRRREAERQRQELREREERHRRYIRQRRRYLAMLIVEGLREAQQIREHGA